ncbi:MAG: dihydroorotate dehydrogenase-like protein [Bacteroidales bacterium]|nr:dihydroorotate dehydrogenase-like protein [Bacteroidales bacterium]
MADLTTTYMGLHLKNPIIIASCGFTDSVAEIQKLEEQGAAAVVLKSLFEEQILMDVDEQRVNNIYGTYADVESYVSFYTKKRRLDDYLKLIRESKAQTSIPIIASINCVSDAQWVEFAGKIQEAGADALELNMFIMPSDETFTGGQIEQIYFDVVKRVKAQTSLPVALKISYFFSGMANFAIRLSDTGISALVLFNRFFNPDIDLETGQIVSSHLYSSPEENSMVLRWTGILSGKVHCDLAATTGIHNGQSAIKNLLMGARAVQISSVIYKKGIPVVGQILREMEEWMDRKGYASLREVIGLMSQQNLSRPMMVERAQFMKYFADV